MVTPSQPWLPTDFVVSFEIDGNSEARIQITIWLDADGEPLSGSTTWWAAGQRVAEEVFGPATSRAVLRGLARRLQYKSQSEAPTTAT